jgi:Tol biopolymer transport system component
MFGVTAVAAVALQLVNLSSHEVQADGHSIHADVSSNGRLVAFDSLAGNLVAAPLQRPDDQEVYLRDRRRGVTRLVSRSSRGQVSNAWSWRPSLSPNGRFVAFCSTASNLARPDRLPRVPHFGPGLDPHTDVDRTVTEAGISADGRTVVFCSEAYNLSRNDGLGDDVFVCDGEAGTTAVISNAGSCVWSADVSSDGCTAVFTADMPGLVRQDVHDVRQSDAFVAEPLR